MAKLKESVQGIIPTLRQKGIDMPDIDENLKIYHAKGCEKCSNTGYRGRIGIYEAFLIDSDIQKLILGETSIVAIKEQAQKKGMITMYQDGLIKVIQGITTVDEIDRVAEK
jgi:type II secretory ATPase GspE/PulE/Tfp pilus assembly ATPase PilB-like protein